MTGTFEKAHEAIGDAKTVAVLAGVALVAFIGYEVYKDLQGPLTAIGQGARTVVKQSQQAATETSDISLVPADLAMFAGGGVHTPTQLAQAKTDYQKTASALQSPLLAAIPGAFALPYIGQELSSLYTSTVANKQAANYTTVAQVRALYPGAPIGGR